MFNIQRLIFIQHFSSHAILNKLVPLLSSPRIDLPASRVVDGVEAAAFVAEPEAPVASVLFPAFVLPAADPAIPPVVPTALDWPATLLAASCLALP